MRESMEMLKAIRANDVRKVSKKLLKGFDVNKQITEPATTAGSKKQHVATIPVCLAATHGLREIVELLLSYGANIHAANQDWSTPLHMSTFHGHMEVVRCLLQRNVNLNVTDQQGNTVLHLATAKNYFEAVVLYLEHGIDFEIRNNKGETAVEIARALNHEHIVNLIEEKREVARNFIYNADEKRVQAKQLMTEFTEKERLHEKMENLKIKELEERLHQKERKVNEMNHELDELNEGASSIAQQIQDLEAQLREINQTRVSKDRLKNNLLEEIEEIKKEQQKNNNHSVTRSRSLKHTGFYTNNESAEYECPICFEMPFAPKKVYQCGNGHVYCSDCKEKPNMTHCPQCRVPLDQMSAIRNIIYEDMLVRKQARRATAM